MGDFIKLNVERAVYNVGMPSAKPSSDALIPRERILVAAHALFYQEGIRATGVDKIIDKAPSEKSRSTANTPAKMS